MSKLSTWPQEAPPPLPALAPSPLWIPFSPPCDNNKCIILCSASCITLRYPHSRCDFKDPHPQSSIRHRLLIQIPQSDIYQRSISPPPLNQDVVLSPPPPVFPDRHLLPSISFPWFQTIDTVATSSPQSTNPPIYQLIHLHPPLYSERKFQIPRLLPSVPFLNSSKAALLPFLDVER